MARALLLLLARHRYTHVLAPSHEQPLSTSCYCWNIEINITHSFPHRYSHTRTRRPAAFLDDAMALTKLLLLLLAGVVLLVLGGCRAQANDAARQQQERERCIYQHLPNSLDSVAYLDWVGMVHLQESFRVDFAQPHQVRSTPLACVLLDASHVDDCTLYAYLLDAFIQSISIYRSIYLSIDRTLPSQSRRAAMAASTWRHTRSTLICSSGSTPPTLHIRSVSRCTHMHTHTHIRTFATCRLASTLHTQSRLTLLIL